MILVKPKATKLLMPQSFEQCLKHIEYCGRVAYKSEDRITDDSSVRFVRSLISRGHLSVLRHVSLRLPSDYFMTAPSPYIYKVGGFWVGNLQAWFEVGHWSDDVSHELYLAFPQIFDKPSNPYYRFETSFSIDDDYQTYKLITDRGVSHELVRHTTLAVTQESSRYCKYGDGVTFVIPERLELAEGFWDGWRMDRHISSAEASLFLDNCLSSESHYLSALEMGLSPQDARGMLNHHVKTELMMSGSGIGWFHFKNVRFDESTGKVHPQMLELTKLMVKEGL